jgi:hypothetical protein
MSAADAEIKKDEGHYRVYEPFARLQGRTSYYHQSVGGYSAVRPRRMDELFTYSFEKGANIDISQIIKNLDQQTFAMNAAVPQLDLLNVKYILLPGQEGDIVVTNPFASGPAWFVNKIQPVTTADDELKLSLNLDVKHVAVVNKEKFPEAVTKMSFVVDSTATIKLDTYEPNHLVYSSSNKNEGFALFSEMYYGKGWNAYIDGKAVPHYQADYAIRALNVPAGQHKIEFKFEPQVIKTGGTISLISFIIFLGLLGAGIWYERKQAGKQEVKVKS